MIARFAIVALPLAALAGGIAAQSPRVTAPPVAVELFTSQGCSSCPPADKIQSTLARDPRVVAITRPVTYWDRLGWKDTLARPANTALQNAYTARGIPGAGNYTPQSVVQGRSGTVGGRGPTILELVTAAQKLPQPALTIARAPGQGATVALDGTTRSPATVTLVALRRTAEVAIGSGENGGRRIAYSNVLIRETPVGHWSGGAQRINVPAAAFATRGADAHALIVRQGETGPILAARYL